MLALRVFLLSLISLLGPYSNSVLAQSKPTVEQFGSELKECVVRKEIRLSDNTLDSITKLYGSDTARTVLTRSTEFLALFPEADRLEAYRLYSDCITTGLPQSPATPAKPPVTVTYKICSGEYARACQPHDVYLYCYQSAAEWAKSRCESATVQRLSVYGGNKCGYSLDAVICTNPK